MHLRFASTIFSDKMLFICENVSGRDTEPTGLATLPLSVHLHAARPVTTCQSASPQILGHLCIKITYTNIAGLRACQKSPPAMYVYPQSVEFTV